MRVRVSSVYVVETLVMLMLHICILFYRDEQQRLEELSKLKYRVKILVNGGVVSETKER